MISIVGNRHSKKVWIIVIIEFSPSNLLLHRIMKSTHIYKIDWIFLPFAFWS